MDYRVEWSPEATEDIESIAEYIARDSEFYARAIVSKILAVSRKIPEQAFTESKVVQSSFWPLFMARDCLRICRAGLNKHPVSGYGAPIP